MKNIKRIFFVLFIFIYACLASSVQEIFIKKAEIFDKDGSTHLLLLLNGIFSSNPKKFVFDGNEVILLKNVILDDRLQENLLKSPLSPHLEIFSKNKSTYIVLNSNDSKVVFDTKAVKSVDGYIVKLIFTPQERINNLFTLLRKPSEIKGASIGLPDRVGGVQSYQYWSVLGVVAFLIIVLIVIKKKLNTTNLVKGKLQDSPLAFQVKFCEKINASNQIILIQNQNHGYLLLIGDKQSFLIDKINLDANVKLGTVESLSNGKIRMKNDDA